MFLQVDGHSDKEPSGKKKKTKSNKGDSDDFFLGNKSFYMQ